MEERKLKGVNFHGSLGAVERFHGADVRARIEAKVEGPGGDAIRAKGIVSGGWYPASWYDALLRAVEEEFPGEKRILRELARSAVIHDFKTLFKLISLVASPEFALKNATRVVARYIDGGTVTLVSAIEGKVHFRFTDYHGFTGRMWEDFIGGMEGILELMKLQRLPTKVLSGGGDGDRLEVVLHYSR